MNAALRDVGILRRPLAQGRPARIAIFRALNLGDMLCAVPAFRALRRHLPQAHITLIGLDSARPVMERYSAYLDELILFPGDAAFPEQEVQGSALPGFYQAMRARHYDLILQMHGSGSRSNDIVQQMEPRQWAGFVDDPAHEKSGRFLLWPDALHEVHRYLALMRDLGVNAQDDRLELPVTKEEHQQAGELAAQFGLHLARTVFIHPGARLASRRWPLQRFAAVAMALIREGWQLALTGGRGERDMAARLHEMAGGGARIVNLCGLTELGVLAALLRRGRLLICNDTGISHVAAAVQAPSVVIASGSDVNRWAPLDTALHTVLYADAECRPCSYDTCPVGHTCALGVEVDQVLTKARQYLVKGERG